MSIPTWSKRLAHVSVKLFAEQHVMPDQAALDACFAIAEAVDAGTLPREAFQGAESTLRRLFVGASTTLNKPKAHMTTSLKASSLSDRLKELEAELAGKATRKPGARMLDAIRGVAKSAKSEKDWREVRTALESAYGVGKKASSGASGCPNAVDTSTEAGRMQAHLGSVADAQLANSSLEAGAHVRTEGSKLLFSPFKSTRGRS